MKITYDLYIKYSNDKENHCKLEKFTLPTPMFVRCMFVNVITSGTKFNMYDDHCTQSSDK